MTTNNPEDHGIENELDRGVPDVSAKSAGASIIHKIVMVIISLLVVVLLVAVNGGFKYFAKGKKVDDGLQKPPEIGNFLGSAPKLPTNPPPPKQKETVEKENDGIINTGRLGGGGAGKKERELTPEERKDSSELLGKEHSTPSQSAQQHASSRSSSAVVGNDLSSLDPSKLMSLAGGGGNDKAQQADSLEARLEPTVLNGAKASLLANRSYFITQGTFLDCALETAISSDVSGMTSCRVTRDVYSSDHKVLLVEGGSRVVGQYKGGMTQGKARIFVLWTRVETPNGVLINVNSPGTDALGRSGFDGFLDTHFWERFGSAIMFSMIDDLGSYISRKSSDIGEIQLNGTADAAKNAAGIALEHSINIPPTLLKNQGEHVNIFVARDLDFRGVYDLKTIQ